MIYGRLDAGNVTFNSVSSCPNNSISFLSNCYAPGTVLSTLSVLTHLIHKRLYSFYMRGHQSTDSLEQGTQSNFVNEGTRIQMPAA